ncbi:uncharacterized protein LOC108807989 [Raphanus sativus]|uniref:Uncharacterized protein LOC108807989 n=1 Tax=Raphanus sativus TaxID=3726 RepID=A0A6J0JJ92_RAPSA|nr:uncharacterized protein LOC108807989 [Raphanus sativus]
MLLDEWGNEHFSEGSKGEIATNYFRELFLSSNPYDLESLFSDFPSRITEEMNVSLTATVSPEEIKKAAMSIDGGSAPGEDGLTGSFYQKYWHIVGPAITKEILYFFETTIIPEGWNHTQLSLIPKISNPSRMKDMRPISLCSVQYKIISKVLCNRLERFLPDVVSETQGAFVSGRLISDNIIIAHEMIHSLRTNDRVSEGFMAIKTDMSKAYDRVEWCFLETLLERMGFDRVWVRWIMACVSTVSYSVLLNGSSHGFIKPERGLRQGDPLSPFLFILCAEALVGCLNRAADKGNLHGIQIGSQGPSVHHLLFADDSLLICKADVMEATEILNCLKMYGDASGQLINPEKSSIIFGSKVNGVTKTEVKEVLGIEAEGGDGMYLGLPECFSGSKMQLLSFLRGKLQGRLSGWFAKSLSQGGKEILLKSICLALPIYAMSCFRLPKDTCARLRSAMIEFWWSSGNNRKNIAWVAWEKLCKSKDKRGLGFKDLEKFNQALLAKQAARILNNPDSLLAQVLKQRYFKNSSFLEAGLGSRPSFAWRSIVHGRGLLQQGLMTRVGSGTNTKVWWDRWVLDKVPRVPEYRQDSVIDLTLTVADLVDHNSGAWNRALIYDTFVQKDAELILDMKRSVNRPDEIVWGLLKNGLYSSKSGYALLDTLEDINSPPLTQTPPVETQLWQAIWKTKTTPKLRHFLWRIRAGALAVKERLSSRGIQLDTTCSSCNDGPEDIGHVLFQCKFAQEVWALAAVPMPPSGRWSRSVFLNLHHLIACSKKHSLQPEAGAIFPWLLWHIWKARNSFCFEFTRLDPAMVWEKAKMEAEVWRNLQTAPHDRTPSAVPTRVISNKWTKPMSNWVKCNISSSWVSQNPLSGGAWIVRDSTGKVVFHSRRSFSNLENSLITDLTSLQWAVESMKSLRIDKVMFETSSLALRDAFYHRSLDPQVGQKVNEILQGLNTFMEWRLDHVESSGNRAAKLIAQSVTDDHRFNSYVATGGPSWLQILLHQESSVSGS